MVVIIIIPAYLMTASITCISRYHRLKMTACRNNRLLVTRRTHHIITNIGKIARCKCTKLCYFFSTWNLWYLMLRRLLLLITLVLLRNKSIFGLPSAVTGADIIWKHFDSVMKMVIAVCWIFKAGIGSCRCRSAGICQ